MTLVQASIAQNGKTVILIADRLLTRQLSKDLPSYEFESPTPKIITREKVGIGFAGSALYADIATSKLLDKTDFDEIVRTISKYIKNEKQSIIEGNIKRLTGVSSNDFFTNPNLAIPKEVRDHIYGTMGKFSLDFNSIIAGFDKSNKARIVFVDEEGDTAEATNFDVFSIGSGSPFSIVYFDQYGYEISTNEKEALLFAFEAKKWAQSHTGVGYRTDILIFRENGETVKIYDDSELMKKINEAYESEINKIKEMRKLLLEKLFKEIAEAN